MNMKNKEELLSSLEIESELPVKKTVIWLHGLGADGSDFVPIISELRLPKGLGIRFIFPHAPVQPVTINSGYRMRAWYDIYSITSDSKIDEAGIAESTAAIGKLIAKEKTRGLTSKDIILAGFSQGAVISLITGISYPEPLAGILALSGYLPYPEKMLAKANAANKSIPIFMAHGTEDEVVPYALDKAAYLALKQAGYNVEWHSYPIAHTVGLEEIADISQWLIKIVN